MTIPENNPSARERYEQEAANIAFVELQKHFAKGILISVDQSLDLIDVAMTMHRDDTRQIETWMSSQQLERAHDEHARKWLEEHTVFLAVTVAPWVLVQERPRRK
jgi:hypothetical protein